MLELFHTSCGEIEKIDDSGLFGSFLFFSSRIYYMGGDTAYKMEIDEGEIINARSLFHHEGSVCDAIEAIITEVAERFGVDEDTAIGFIDESRNPWDELDEIDGEDSWYIQHCTARVARALGFRGVRVTDEQGGAYMIDMLGRERDLIKVN